MGRRWSMAASVGVLLLAACTSGTGRVATGPPSAPASPLSSSPLPSPSSASTSSLATTATPGHAVVPPDASIVAEGGDPVVGQLGSYTWADGGSDSPWLPGAPVSVGAGESLTVVVSGRVPIEAWTARRTPGGATSDERAVPIGSGGAIIGFRAPPGGDWTIEVTVRFLGGGSASYAWRLEVT